MKRLILRILYIIPITLSIIWLSLFLFYKLPSKRTLDTDQIQLGSSADYINLLSATIQTPVGRVDERKPLFYLSILPVSVPPVYYRFPIPFRENFKDLCLDINNKQGMENYGEWLIRQLENLSLSGRDQISSQNVLELLNCNNKSNFYDFLSENPVPVNIKKSVVVGEGKRDPMIPYYLEWNGMKNIFHQQLKLLFSDENYTTNSGAGVYRIILSALSWTICYSFPGLLMALAVPFFLVLFFYPLSGKKKILPFLRKFVLVFYSLPTFVLATMALIFLTSGRYGTISEIFPFPDFYRTGANSFFSVLRYHAFGLILPALIFALNPGVALFRIFDEKVSSLNRNGGDGRYFLHLGISNNKVRFKYLASHLVVTLLGTLSNLFVGMIAGSLIIELVFNIPGLGRLFYHSVIGFDINLSVTLIVFFTILHQLGHIFSDWMVDRFMVGSEKESLLI